MQAQQEVQSAILLDVVTRQQPSILEFLVCETPTLLVWRDVVFASDLRGSRRRWCRTPQRRACSFVNVSTKICIRHESLFTSCSGRTATI